MIKEEFWNIIHKSKKAKNVDEINTIISYELNQLNIDELVSYSNHFYELFYRAYNWDLWNAAYIIQGGCGDDAFMDFRGSLISLGKNIYEKSLENPDFLATLEELEEKQYNESFAYFVGQIYREKTGNDIDDDVLYHLPKFTEPTGTNIDFEDENIKDIIMKKYPRITKRYW